ncbi:toxin VasX [Thioclava sp. GXIMD4215]|uniref:toxin VasX n=1 Tax=Thioclava sp. GXIMD4215 TaxID=3131928 RepID=UPI00324E1EBB
MPKPPFSETTETEQLSANCDPTIIPIFPVRFALTLDALSKMLDKGSATPPTPSSIDDLAAHELLRIRQGFFYTWDGTYFQIFRFQTVQGDANSADYSPKADVAPKGSYVFSKYEFQDENGDKKDSPEGTNWKLLNETYPYAFVPKDTPVVWVAYSENPWPSKVFFDIPHNTDTRDTLMTRLDLASRSGPFSAPITELAKRVSGFRRSSETGGDAGLDDANVVRMTTTRSETPSFVVSCINTAEKGVLAAIHDPIGELQDICGLISTQVMTQQNFVAQHQYPLVIGKAVKSYQEQEKVSSESGWIKKAPLSQEFDSRYQDLFEKSEAFGPIIFRLAFHWLRKLIQNDTGSFMSQYSTMVKLCGRYSATAHPNDHRELVAACNMFFASAKAGEANCSELSLVAASVFNDLAKLPKGDTADGGLLKAAQSNVSKILSFTKSLVSTTGKVKNNFWPALNAVIVVYGNEMVEACFTGSETNATRVLATQMFRKEVTFQKATELRSTFQELLTADGYTAPKLVDQTYSFGRATDIFDSAENQILGDLFVQRWPADGELGAVEFRVNVTVEVDSNYKRFASQVGKFDTAANGLGLLASLLSLHGTIKTWGANSYGDKSDVGALVNSSTGKFISGFSSAYGSVYSLNSARKAVPGMAASKKLAGLLFKENPWMKTYAMVREGQFGNIAKSVRIGPLAAKATGVVGIVFSGFLSYEGIKREDYAMAIGNGMAVVGGVALLFVATGPIALIAIGVIFVGGVISMMADSDIETWVRQGFWGTHSEYWGTARPSLDDQTIQARVLAKPEAQAYENMKFYYDQELQRYLDMNASVKIVDTLPNDGQIEIKVSKLESNAQIGKLQVEVVNLFTGPHFSELTRSVDHRVAFQSAGTAVVTLPRSAYIGAKSKLRITANYDDVNAGSPSDTRTFTHESIW